MKNINSTLIFENKPSIASFGAVVGKKEGEGPLGKYFDMCENDAYLGKKSWEQAESGFLGESMDIALKKANISKDDIDFVFSGDLMNQCTSSGYAARGLERPFFGLYGACSTMAESLLLGSVIVDGGGGNYVLCATGSHFCSAEKQFRTPVEYGGQRTPTSQWTVTGSGAAVLSHKDFPIKIDCATVGRVIDWGIKDANNMGGAMAPAFVDTLNRHFKATQRPLDYYDLILSGDLGHTGKSIANELFHKQKMDISRYYDDCGVMIFDKETQDTHSGGSGCGCSASVLCGYILPQMLKGKYRRVLFAATGALMSPTLTMQSETIPSISHAISITLE